MINYVCNWQCEPQKITKIPGIYFLGFIYIFIFISQAALEKSRCRFRYLMSKPDAMVSKKKSLRQHKEETLRETELKRE